MITYQTDTFEQKNKRMLFFSFTEMKMKLLIIETATNTHFTIIIMLKVHTDM